MVLAELGQQGPHVASFRLSSVSGRHKTGGKSVGRHSGQEPPLLSCFLSELGLTEEKPSGTLSQAELHKSSGSTANRRIFVKEAFTKTTCSHDISPLFWSKGSYYSLLYIATQEQESWVNGAADGIKIHLSLASIYLVEYRELMRQTGRERD